MNHWRPTPDEERWLDLASRLRGAIPPGTALERSSGWRSTGPFARVALFVLGVLAAALTLVVLGVGDDETLLAASAIAVGAAEWLKRGKRLHASGIEEGLCAAGYLMFAVWLTGKSGLLLTGAGPDRLWIATAAALAAAGIRLLNAGLTTVAAIVFVEWFGSTDVARAIGGPAGGGMAAFVVACAAAAVALLAGAREFRRPSHDRMLNGLVIALPVLGYQWHAAWTGLGAPTGTYETASVRLITTVLLLAVGIASLVAGLRRRRHAPLIGFLGCLGCLAVEWSRGTTWPTEFWLLLYGAIAIAAAATVDRYLRNPRDGITSAKLSDREGALDLLQTVGASVLAQRSSGPVSPAEPAAPTHEGRFGGGGATGNF